MCEITKISYDEQQHTFAINVEDMDPLVVSYNTLEQFKLSVGMIVDEALLSQLRKESLFHRSTAIALNFLSYRPRSSLEIKNKLLKSGIPSESIEKTLDYLSQKNFLNDDFFTDTFLTNMMTLKMYSKKRMRHELAIKGISNEIIRKYLNAIPPDYEFNCARVLAEKRIRSIKPSDQRKKIWFFLANKGFDYDTINHVIADLGIT